MADRKITQKPALTNEPLSQRRGGDSIDGALMDVGVTLGQCEDGLRIDKKALDDEVAYQPELFYRVADLHSFAISYRDKAKNEFESTESEINLLIRQEPVPDGEKPPTVDHVRARVANHPQVAAAKQLHMKWEDMARRCANLQTAFEHRRDALKALSQQWVAGLLQTSAYNSSDVRAVVDEKVKSLRDKLAGMRNAPAR